MIRRLKPVLFLLAALNARCGGRDSERPEVLGDKLRPLGVVSNPIVAAPGQAVTLTYWVATPAGQTLTAEAIAPEKVAPPTFAAQGLTFKPETLERKDYGDVSLHSIQATYTVPVEAKAVFPMLPAAKVRFGTRLTAASGTVDMVSDLFVFPEGSPEQEKAKQGAPKVEIVLGSDTFGQDQDVDIKATVTGDAIDDSYKVGWFVTGGEVKNRRARDTKWKTPKKAGKHVLVFTVRGKKTKALALAVKEVTIQ